MTQEGKDKIITRAIHFIETNTKDESYRIGQAIIAELNLVKKLNIDDVSKVKQSVCMDYDDFQNCKAWKHLEKGCDSCDINPYK